MTRRSGIVSVLVVATLVACRPPPKEDVNAPFLSTEAGISLPRRPGWMLDTDAASDSMAVLRMRRSISIAGAPRIDVIVEYPAPGKPPNLELFALRSDQQLKSSAHANKLRITYEDRRNEKLGVLPAIRLRYDYELRAQPPIPISQVSYLLVVGQREVTVTAVGRTELFAPLSDDIEEMLHGVVVLQATTVKSEGSSWFRDFFSVRTLAAPEVATMPPLRPTFMEPLR
jgi:hypothetical protein